MSAYQIQLICKLIIPKKNNKMCRIKHLSEKKVARDVAYALPVTISATGAILHTLHFVLKRVDLPAWLYVTTQISVILNTCNIVVTFLGDSTFHK